MSGERERGGREEGGGRVGRVKYRGGKDGGRERWREGGREVGERISHNKALLLVALIKLSL